MAKIGRGRHQPIRGTPPLRPHAGNSVRWPAHWNRWLVVLFVCSLAFDFRGKAWSEVHAPASHPLCLSGRSMAQPEARRLGACGVQTWCLEWGVDGSRDLDGEKNSCTVTAEYTTGTYLRCLKKPPNGGGEVGENWALTRGERNHGVLPAGEIRRDDVVGVLPPYFAEAKSQASGV